MEIFNNMKKSTQDLNLSENSLLETQNKIDNRNNNHLESELKKKLGDNSFLMGKSTNKNLAGELSFLDNENKSLIQEELNKFDKQQGSFSDERKKTNNQNNYSFLLNDDSTPPKSNNDNLNGNITTTKDNKTNYVQLEGKKENNSVNDNNSKSIFEGLSINSNTPSNKPNENKNTNNNNNYNNNPNNNINALKEKSNGVNNNNNITNVINLEDLKKMENKSSPTPPSSSSQQSINTQQPLIKLNSDPIDPSTSKDPNRIEIELPEMFAPPSFNLDIEIDQKSELKIPKPIHFVFCTRWCSWCWEITDHEQTEKNWLARNKHTCIGCSHETIPCVGCNTAMCRSYGTSGSDKLCFKCDGTFAKHSRNINGLIKSGKCSWCCKTTEHKVFRNYVMRRSVYQCLSCKQKTLECKKCAEFAKGSDTWDEDNCIVCQGVFPSWESASKMKIIKKERWCSWCVEQSDHQLVQKNFYTRDVYFCESCTNKTICCMKCMRDMAKFSSLLNTFLCTSCHFQVLQKKMMDPLTFWKNLQLKRNMVLDPNRWKIQQIMSQLEKSSEFKEKSRKEGMLRPFLILVSMPPIMRNKVANLIGISLLSESFFGDPHNEAYHVLNSIQDHCQQFYEKVLNKIGKRCNWFDVLRRTIDTVLKKSPIIKCDDWWKTYDECLVPDSKLIQMLEKEFLLKLSDHCEQKEFFPQEKTEDEVETDEFTMRFILNTLPNINTEKIIRYYVHVLKYYNKHNLNLFEAKTDDLDLQYTEDNTSLKETSLPKSLSRSSALLWYDEKLVASFPKFHSLESSDGLIVSFGNDYMVSLFYVVILILNQDFILKTQSIDINSYYKE
eukprot:TRINITY_DN3360_c0_g1_i2.p1 TRINITY_DN3360_c0_g1~~TRINITY_DN3360_c0_g1_i2.p1  ORF type:complete len:908 (-),score=235.30 TRINITY_DN3360_c0_g1_i2:81-2588(-)